jgi:hypothetical protein
MSASIFISFAAPDRKVASTLCKALESRGFKCWFSSRDILPGENFQVAIVRAIRKAKILLLVFTANSNASEEMTKELALASQERLIVVPLRVEDVAPNEAFAYEFATRQWIDFFADWEAAIDQLSERLAQALPSEAQPDPALIAARAEPSGRALSAAPALMAPPSLERAGQSPLGLVARAPAAPEPPAHEPSPPEPSPLEPPAVAKAPAPVEPRAEITPSAPPPKAAAPRKPKPAPEPPAPGAPKLVRDSIRAEAPVAADDVAQSAPKKRAGLLAVAAVVVVALIGLGLAAPSLFGKKPAPKAALARVAVAAPVQPAIPEAVPVAAEAVPDAAPAEPEPVKAAPKPRHKAAPKPKDDDVPY